MNRDIKVLVCCHKEDNAIINEGIYYPIQVGSALSSIDLGFERDDNSIEGGGNISRYNNQYSELTALYWAWKEMPPVKYIGLVHYRRYFHPRIDESYIRKILKNQKYDVIVGKPIVGKMCNGDELERYIGYEDYYIMLNEVLKQHPECASSLISYAKYSREWIPCNMFISSRAWMLKYCIWLFPILESVRKSIKISSYTRQQRSLGYMGEFLLGVYLIWSKSKVKKVDYYHIRGEEYVFVSKSYIRRYVFSCVWWDSIKRKIYKLIKKKYTFKTNPSIVNGLSADGIKIANLINL